MSLLDQLSERMFYANRKTYSEQKGNVAYLDASGLRRSFKMPSSQLIIAAVFVIIAIVIGYNILDRTVLAAQRSAAAVESTVEANLSRPASIDSTPSMAYMSLLDDEGIIADFEATGYKVYNATELSDSYNLLLYKLPDDVSVEEAAVMYGTGVGSLDVTQATKLLNGAWMLGTDRENGSMILRYADFSTGDPQVAVQNAIDRQGYDRETITESGEDDSGNTFATGTVDADGSIRSWKVSALPLDDIYSISGMPKDVCYVGVRINC